MPTIAIVSQKGGAGKTTLAVNIAAAAERAGLVAAVIDADPQATAAQWGEWREAEGGEDPVITAPARKIAKAVASLHEEGAQLVVIDTPPHAEHATSEAVAVADLALVACKPAAFDLEAIKTTAAMLAMRSTPAFVVFMGGPPNAPRLIEDASALAMQMGLQVAPVQLANRAAFRNSVGIGKAAIETDYYQPAGIEVRELFQWVERQLKLPNEGTANG